MTYYEITWIENCGREHTKIEKFHNLNDALEYATTWAGEHDSSQHDERYEINDDLTEIREAEPE